MGLVYALTGFIKYIFHANIWVAVGKNGAPLLSISLFSLTAIISFIGYPKNTVHKIVEEYEKKTKKSREEKTEQEEK